MRSFPGDPANTSDQARRKARSTHFRRWRQLLANRGAWAVARTAAAMLWRLISNTIPGTVPSELWRAAAVHPAQAGPFGHPFDLRHGTETSGLIWGEDMPTGHAHDVWSTAYYGIAPSAFAQAMAMLVERETVDLAEFTFVDLGSGKGRAVLLASLLPLARVLGVEMVPRLHAVATANLARFRASPDSVENPQAELLLADATEFPWTGQLRAISSEPLSGSLLLFLYNPFSRPVLRALLQRIRAELAGSLDRNQKLTQVLLLYVNPELDDELTRHPWIARLWQETVQLDDEDKLADRFGSTTETFAVYRCAAGKD
jgi:SAM-dependent methyltransferase